MRVTLNIKSKEIRLAAMEGDRVQKWGVAPLEVGQVKDGHILQPQAVGAAVASLFKSLRVPKDFVWLTVSGLVFTYRVIDLPKMKSLRMEEAVLRAARKEIPLPLEQLYLSWDIVSSEENEVKVFMVGVTKTLIDDIVQSMKFAGVTIGGIDLQPLALARVARKPNALVVEFEPDCFDIVIVANGVPTVLHTVTPKTDGSTIEDNVLRLSDELSRTVNFFNITHANSPLPPTTPVLLTGSLSSDENAVNLLQKSLEYHIEPLVPQVRFAPDFPFARFAGNIGLALKNTSRLTRQRGDSNRFYDVNVNLLSHRKRDDILKSQARTKSRLLQTVLVVAMLLFLPAFLMRNQAITEIARLQTQLDRVSRELRLARLSQDEATKTEVLIQQLDTETKGLQQERQQVLTRDGDVVPRLQTVLDLLPKDSTLVSLEVNSEEIIIQGLTNNRDEVINYALALYNLKQFTGVRIASIGEEASKDSDKTSKVVKVSFTIVLGR